MKKLEETRYILKKKESVDWWILLLSSTFSFFVGVGFYSFFVDGLGLKEISGFFGAAAAIIAGIIAYIGTRRNTQKTIEIQKEISSDNNKLQKKLQKDRIDADLKAKARIEWIQNARNEASELITQIAKLHQSYDAIINGSLDKDGGYGRAYKRFNECYSAINKLVLFFGPDDIDSSSPVVESEIRPGQLYSDAVIELKKNNKNNVQKNNKIVGMLKLLKNYLVADEVNIKNEIFKKANNKSLQYALTNDLNDILRLYFKLEWNRAKQGE